MRTKTISLSICMLLLANSLLIPSIIGYTTLTSPGEPPQLTTGNGDVDDVQSITRTETSDEWTTFRHDSEHTGASTSTAPDKQIIKWITSVEDVHPGIYGEVMSPCAIADNKVYLGLNYQQTYFWERVITCLDAETSELLWYFFTPNRLYSTPTIYDGKVYVSSSGYSNSPTAGILYCLDAGNGSLLWSFSVDSYLPYSPTVADGKVFIYARDTGTTYSQHYGLYCLNATTGHTIWHTTYGLVYGSIAYHDGNIYIKREVGGGYYDGIECINATNGQEVWQFIIRHIGSSDADHLSSLSYYGEKIYVLTAIGGGALVTCLDAEGDGAGHTTQLWNTTITYYDYPAIPSVMTPCLAYGHVYVSCGDVLYCFDAISGAVVFQKTLVYGITSECLAIADDKIYATASYSPDPSTTYSAFICLDAYDGDTIWTFDSGGGSFGMPSIANGCVYCFGPGGLYCFGGPNHAPETPMIPLGPSMGTSGTSYVFSTKTTDFDRNTVKFGWDWDGDLVVDDWTEYYATYPDPEVADSFHSWEKPGYYEVRVKAKDINGDESDWSDPAIMLISPRPVELDVNVSGGIGISLTIKNIQGGDASNVAWTMSFDEGFILRPAGGSTHGAIGTLVSGDQTAVRINVLGFGKTTLTIEVTSTDADSVSKVMPAFILGPFVFLALTG